MDSKQFKEFGKAVIDFLAEYHDTIRDRPVMSSVSPGYLRPLVPDSIPNEPESWQDVLKDVDRVVMPGVTHWQAPGFHAYYPSISSFPSIIGELMSAGLGVVGFSWVSGPACTELEIVMMDWLAKAMDLPDDLLNSSDSEGGGCFQGSASESTVIALLAAKEKTVQRVRQGHPHLSPQDIKTKLVCYTSDQANSSVEKASLLASVPIRLLPTDKNGSLTGRTVATAIKKDLDKGLIPCFVTVTYGTTGTCAFDNLEEISAVCARHEIWVHVDAAYAGVARICPELRPYMPALHHADSIVTNLHKWLLLSFDCSAMWFKNRRFIEDTFTVDRVYLPESDKRKVPDLRNYQIPLGRRFRALKVWFTLRTYGLSGLQQHVRSHVSLAKVCEQRILADHRFLLAAPTCMGLVCFRTKEGNELTKKVLEQLTRRRKVHLVSGELFGNLFLRLVVNSPSTSVEDINNSVDEIIAATDVVMRIDEDIKPQVVASYSHCKL